MRKSRVVVKDVEIRISENGTSPPIVLEALDKLGIVAPSWSVMMFFFARAERQLLDVTFFEDPKDFFVWYSKVMIRKSDDFIFASYSKDGGTDWKLFAPPTLVGVNLQTKLRF